MTEDQKIRKLLGLLEKHFDGDKKKVRLWLNIYNPMFGMIKPKTMIENGKISKVLKFVENCLDENER